MAKAKKNTKPVVTVAHVRGWLEQIKKLDANIARDQAKRLEIQNNIEFVSRITGVDYRVDTKTGKLQKRAVARRGKAKFVSPPIGDGLETMGDAIKRIVASYDGKSIFHKVVVDELSKSPHLMAVLDRNPTYYYSTISRLHKAADPSVKRTGKKRIRYVGPLPVPASPPPSEPASTPA
jgi:hypothetical protein